MKIYKKLHEIQSKVKGLSKDKKSHNYDYVTGNKVLSFIKPLMDDLGLILKQEILSIENTRQDYKTKYGEKSEILSKVMMRFTWIDIETGEKDENLFGANGQNDWEKGLGSALTYAERYFILKYFHIPTDADDIDNPARKEKPQEKVIAKPIKMTEKRLKVLELKIQTIMSQEALNEFYKSLVVSEKTNKDVINLLKNRKQDLNNVQ